MIAREVRLLRKDCASLAAARARQQKFANKDSRQTNPQSMAVHLMLLGRVKGCDSE